MGVLAIGLGTLLCSGGAWAHFRDPTRQREGTFALGGFCCLVLGLFLTRS